MTSHGASRPRILLAVTLAESGGAQSYVSLLLPALIEHFDVVVAAHGSGPLIDASTSAGAKFVSLEHVRRPINPWRDALGFIELVRLCRRERPDIFHANSSKAGVLGRLAAFVTGVPVRIFTAHGWAFSARSGFASSVYLWAERLLRRAATSIICVSENERAVGLAAGACDAQRTVVIRNGVDLNASPAADSNSPPLLVSVGRMKEPKDFPTLVRALARIDHDSFQAIVVGDGPARADIARELELLGLDDVVQLLGDRRDVPDLLARADLFVLSTTSEGLPMSILEAMAAGLPVVASAVGGVAELVVHGETGRLVPARDPDALAEALRGLIADGQLRRRLGRAGRLRVEEFFDLRRFRDAHISLYRRELSARGLPLPEP